MCVIKWKEESNGSGSSSANQLAIIQKTKFIYKFIYILYKQNCLQIVCK